MYSKRKLETVCGLGTVTGLCGANCYHSYSPFIKGIDTPTYSEEELDRMNEEENTPKEYSGKKYTAYEAQQRQRRLETAMRADRQKIELLTQGGADDDTITGAKVKYFQRQDEYVKFSKAMNLPQQWERVIIDGKNALGSKLPKKAGDVNKISGEAVANSSKGDIIKEDQLSELGKFKKRIRSDGSMSEEYYSAVKKKFSHGSDSAKAAFNKFIPENSVENSNFEGTPHYSPVKKKVSMHYKSDLHSERGSCVTWFHEHGHMLDDMVGRVSDNSEFFDALNSDYMAYMKTYGKKNGLKTFDKVQSAISLDLSSMREHSAVSDILEGLSHGNIKGVSGHRLGYWKNDSVVCSEAFAHMFEAQFDNVRYVQMKKYFPNALAKFESILGGLV